MPPTFTTPSSRSHLLVTLCLSIGLIFPLSALAGSTPAWSTLPPLSDPASSVSSPGRHAHTMTGGVPPEAIPPDGSSTEDNEDVDLANGLIIDINTATVNELAAALPGIGPSKAQRIVEWREANGPFQNVEQLLEVSGIGPKTLERIRPFVRIGNEVSMHGLRTTVDPRERAFIEALEIVISQAVRARADSIETLSAP